MSQEGRESRDRSDWVLVALARIGTAIIVADGQGRVAAMNPVAEVLTGWHLADAVGQPVATVFRVVDDRTRQPVADPVAGVIASGSATALTNRTVLIARNGTEWFLEEGAAPLRDGGGSVVGAVLVFHDISERHRAERAGEDARALAEGIVESIREPLAVLDVGLRVRTANRAFYRAYATTPTRTEARFVFDIPGFDGEGASLRALLEGVLSRGETFNDFEIDAVLPDVGRRVMLINARRVSLAGSNGPLILLAAEDVTDRRRTSEALATSEARYRRLFETAQDGILIVDADTRRVFDSNPFLSDLLGFARDELVGKELWEIGLFRDIAANRVAFRMLQENGYIRYDDLPLLTRDGRRIEVEFVSNVYTVGGREVIQCNIRDVTDRKRAVDALRAAQENLEARVRDRTAELARSNESLTAEIARRERAEDARHDLQRRLTTAQEDERRRIARELHDQMGQHLTALSLGLKLVRDAVEVPSPAGDRLQQLQALTDLIGREVHQLALELRPTALDDLGLQTALTNYTEGWSERSGVEIDFHASGLDGNRLPAVVETALYRVVQEALTNVLRHAEARRVSLVLRRSQAQVHAVIEDDGRGFDPDAELGQVRDRLGLLGMQERVALVGGTVTVESSPGRGTTVIVRVPLPAAGGGNRGG